MNGIHAQSTARPPIGWGPVLAASCGVVALHLVVNALDAYGIFRDEYYYLACARRLAWGYVDQPPLSIALLAAQVRAFGDGLFALRLLPSLLSGVVVLLAALSAREMGGGRCAQGSAALLAAFVPCFLGLCGYYSMNAIDLAIWAVVTLLLARLANGAGRETWILLGVALGLGLLNKLSVLYLGVGIGAALLMTPLRRKLSTPWPWTAAGLAFLIASPHLLWQVAHDWPTLEFIRRAAALKNVEQTPLGFLTGVAFEGNPLFVPLWLLALGFGLVAREQARHRWAAWLAIAVVATLALSRGAKPYYADPALLPLVALFGLACERWLRPVWARLTVWGLIVLAGTATMPFAIPVLSVERLVAYSEAIGMTSPAAERARQARLPQFFADRFGWVELAEAVSEAYGSLSAAERESAVVFGRNYGQAAALEYFDDRYDLPRVISAHNSYWIWGPGDVEGAVWIVLGDGRGRLEELFDSVELSTIKRCQECMPYENDLPVWVCRGLRVDDERLWIEIKNFI